MSQKRDFFSWKVVSFLCIIFFILGTLLFLVRRSWLIVHWVPSYSARKLKTDVFEDKQPHKKNIFLFYWDGECFKKEKQVFVWLPREGKVSGRLNIPWKMGPFKRIVSNWLTLMYEEQIVSKKIAVESVAFSSSGQEVYISFDQPLFLPEWSIYHKWNILIGLRRTIFESGLKIQKITFLVKNEPMQDDHLDFSQPWSVDRSDI